MKRCRYVRSFGSDIRNWQATQFLQRFTLTCGREERFLNYDACFPRARIVHIFSYVVLDSPGLRHTFYVWRRGMPLIQRRRSRRRSLRPEWCVNLPFGGLRHELLSPHDVSTAFYADLWPRRTVLRLLCVSPTSQNRPQLFVSGSRERRCMGWRRQRAPCGVKRCTHAVFDACTLSSGVWIALPAIPLRLGIRHLQAGITVVQNLCLRTYFAF